MKLEKAAHPANPATDRNAKAKNHPNRSANPRTVLNKPPAFSSPPDYAEGS
jgi:hypothetical protein